MLVLDRLGVLLRDVRAFGHVHRVARRLEALKKEGIDFSKAVIIGGPPCQAYSLVGRSRMSRAKASGEYVETEDAPSPLIVNRPDSIPIGLLNLFPQLAGSSAIFVRQELSGEDLSGLPRFGHRMLNLEGLSQPVFSARTGYTGEDGAELLLNADDGQKLWQLLLDRGVTPCGLGARDTLRLEAAMHLYGQDMNDKTNPFEAGLGWLVHLEMPVDFVGRQALEQAAESGPAKRLVGLKLQGRAIARHDYPVMHNGETVGIVTSGTWSPTLEEAIALAYVPPSLAKLGTELSVEIRGKAQPATVVRKPFYKRA